MTTQLRPPVYMPVPNGLKSEYSIDFTVDATYNLILSGTFEGSPVTPVSLYFDNLNNDQDVAYNIGGTTGTIPAYATASIAINGAMTAQFQCNGSTTSQAVFDVLNYPITYGTSNPGRGISPSLNNYPVNAPTYSVLQSNKGSGYIGHQNPAANTILRKVSDRFGDFEISISDFGADPTFTNDSTNAIQNAINLASSYNKSGVGGATVLIPHGIYLANGDITLPSNVHVRGQGKMNSIIKWGHTGNGFVNAYAANSSNPARLSIRDLGIWNTNAANAGGGINQVCGSEIIISGCYFQGWKYNIIFDQTEISAIIDNSFLETGPCVASIWLVNGADHTANAQQQFTNRIVIHNNEFNSNLNTSINIQDDGGANHYITSNNFNGGNIGVRISAAYGLQITGGNEFEGHASNAIYLADTSTAGNYVGPSQGFIIDGNTITDACAVHVYIYAAFHGKIKNNFFGQQTTCSIYHYSDSLKSAGIEISGNSKLIMNNAAKTVAPIVNQNNETKKYQNNRILQGGVTFSNGNPSYTNPGMETITPASMENIFPGMRLVCGNPDGTNYEQVLVTSVTAGTFNANFASSKQANFIIVTGNHEEMGNSTPNLFGSTTSGANTYTTQALQYFKRFNKVEFSGKLVLSAKDATMAGNLAIGGLPFISNPNGPSSPCCLAISAYSLTSGFTQLIGTINPNLQQIDLLKMGNGQGWSSLTAAELGSAPLTLEFSGHYFLY